MSKTKMDTKTEKLPYPKSVGLIVANEFCERFSYYGMRTILSLYLRDKLGYSDDGATIIYHVFTMFAYFFPLVGAMIADAWLGRFRTIFYLSIVYACGSSLITATAVPQLTLPRLEFTIVALLLIAFGTGGIKPCVSAFGGDQFKLPQQEKYLSYFFSLFYFAINAGSLISTFVTPILRADVSCFGDNDCYSFAFGVPGVLMIISIVIFVAGRKLYIIKNPSGNVLVDVSKCASHAAVTSWRSKDKKEHWLDHAEDKYDRRLIQDIKGLFRVLVLFIPLPVFWALFDQQGSRWTFQADRMEQQIGSFTLKADQMQVLNPLLILLFIPLFQVAIYPFMTWARLIRKPLHKMIWGGVLAAAAFVISGVVELQLLPTYGTPVATGLAQLRVYNGFNCNLTLSAGNATDVDIGPLAAYQQLDIPADNHTTLPYSIRGTEGACASVDHDGTFVLKEKTANSFFVSYNGVYDFTDNNDKAIDSVGVRFLTNINRTVTIRLQNTKTNMTAITIPSSNTEELFLAKGTYNVIVDDVTALSLRLEAGGVTTVNVFEEANGGSIVRQSLHKKAPFSHVSTLLQVANGVQITPPNSMHILWLIPQYVVITMAEVMFSITGLEFSFTQAPSSMKSVLQSLWLITVAFGNLIVVLIVQGNFLDAQWKEFFLFAGLMFLDILIFAAMAFRYQYVDQSSSGEGSVEEIRLPDKTPVDA